MIANRTDLAVLKPCRIGAHQPWRFTIWHGVALLAALLGERQYPLFEFSRLAYQGDTLLLVTQIDICLSDLG